MFSESFISGTPLVGEGHRTSSGEGHRTSSGGGGICLSIAGA